MINTLRNLFNPNYPKKEILLYGLQRSGTNYLETLVNLNYPNCKFINSEVRNEIMHKHFRLYDNKNYIPEPKFDNQFTFNSFAEFEQALPLKKKPDLYLIMSKDPYSWFTSYVGWSKKNNWPNRNYHYINEYNLFYGKWMEFSKENPKIIFIRYADLLNNPLEQINTIANELGLPLKNKVITTKKVYASKKFTDDKKDAFLNRSYMDKISPEELSQINNLLNADLLQRMGYATQSPASK